MLKNVIKEHKDHFPVIFKKVCECMEIIFSIKVNGTSYFYVLIKLLDLSTIGC